MLRLSRSTVIQHITQLFGNNAGVAIGYFYCDYKDVNKRDTRKILGTLVAEICRQSPEALEHIEEISSKYREFKSPCTLDTLCSALKECLDFQSRNFVIIDALDECNDRDEILRFIVDLAISCPKLNLLLMSRKEKNIQRELQSLPQMTLTDVNTIRDIERFVRSSLNAMIKSKRLKLRDESLHQEICESLCSRANGMYIPPSPSYLAYY